jgi:hypothetical protein
MASDYVDINPFIPEPVENYGMAYTIPSYVVLVEGDAFFFLAKQAKIGIIEIGSWLGRSSCILAEGSKQSKRVKVICVDKWADFIPEENIPNCLTRFIKSTENYRYEQLLEHYVGSSETISKTIDTKADLIFIDGNHEYESVKADIEAWLPHCDGEWVMAFHDYCTQPWLGVTKAVNEYFEGFEVVRSLAVCRKKNLKKKWKKLFKPEKIIDIGQK